MRLLVAVTAHGYGHAAQVAPVIDALARRRPHTAVTLMTSVPQWFLRQRIHTDFELVEQEPDFGLLMNSALDIDIEASARAYAELHRSWEARVSDEARRLKALRADLVLADVPYLTLAAAYRAGIPAVALCSLNWADIYRYYFGDRAEAPPVLAEMEAAYNSAHRFLCPEPSMAMPTLANKVSIGAIAVRGANCRAKLNSVCGIPPDTKLVLVAPGGVRMRFAMEHWPVGQGIHWLVSRSWQVRHPEVTAFERAGMSFTDLVASCDAVLGKCGYGTVTECVVNGTPLLYVPRPGWPEEATLLAWLRQRDAAVAVPPARLESGQFSDIMAAARMLQVKRCNIGGAEEAAEVLSGYLTRHPLGKIDVSAGAEKQAGR
jgi:hypothetical protein